MNLCGLLFILEVKCFLSECFEFLDVLVLGQVGEDKHFMFIETEVFDKHFLGELGSLFVSSIRRAIEVCVN